jgi:hypothetical protein
VSQQVWHVKEPSLLKAVNANHRSKFAALCPVIVKNCSCDSNQSNKQANLKLIECIKRKESLISNE